LEKASFGLVRLQSKHFILAVCTGVQAQHMSAFALSLLRDFFANWLCENFEGGLRCLQPKHSML